MRARNHFVHAFFVAILAHQTLHAQVKAGILVHLGCGDGTKTAALAEGGKYTVQGLDPSPENVQKARSCLKSQNLYGPITVELLKGNTLPYADNLANVLVVDNPGSVGKDEMLRVVAPGGMLNLQGKISKKPWPKDIDQWTEYLHGPDNNAVSQDTTISLPRSLQWQAGPRWTRSHENFSSVSALVSANGRVFSIIDRAPLESIRFDGDWHLVAEDAFNGTQLWDIPIKVWNDPLRHFRSGPASLPKRLMAVNDTVYVTLGYGAPVVALDAATGKLLKTYEGTEFAEEITCYQGKLILLVGTSESKRITSGEGSEKGLYDRGEPGATNYRYLMVLDAATGKKLWQINAKGKDYVLPLGVAIKGSSVYVHHITGLASYQLDTGKQNWFAPRPSMANRYGFSTSTLVATEKVVLLADRSLSTKKGKTGEGLAAATDDPVWGIHGWNISDNRFSRNGESKLVAYQASDGKQLWEARVSEGYNSPTDVFVVGNLVWVGPFAGKGESSGRNILTGVVEKKINADGDRVGMAHHRCYRDKASVNYIFGGHDGIEVYSLDSGYIRNDSWIRGMCQYGIMPANGFFYAPQDPCACHPKNRLQGFTALSSHQVSSFGKPIDPVGRLEKGPAYARLQELAKRTVSESDWPAYRHDNSRSGSTSIKIVNTTGLKWKVGLGGDLTQPVVAQGRVYVAAKDRNTLYALNFEDGKEMWEYTTDGRIDSAPTIYKGVVLVGSSDGKVTCLDSATGEVVWRFTAAPEARTLCIFGHLESAWPVHGAVLVQNDKLYFTAGRSTYLDGGIYFYELDPLTGAMLHAKTLSSIDFGTEKNIGKEARFDSPGTISDILSGDNSNIFLKQMVLDEAGNEQPDKPHLFTAAGFLTEEMFVRAYWLYGSEMDAGWGGWANAANRSPFGKILSVDGDWIFGYGREEIAAGAAGHTKDTYHLFDSPRSFGDGNATGNKGKKKSKASGKTYLWSETCDLIVRGLVVTKNLLAVTGLPDIAQKSPDILAFENEQEALDAYLGKKGASLEFYEKGTGKKVRSVHLPAEPVFDTLSAANGFVLFVLKDGTLWCCDAKGE